MNVLVLGGSGFISRYVVQEAMAHGYETWYLTRGQRGEIPGAHALIADRNDHDAFTAAIRSAGCRFDAVLDCICFSAEQAREDLTVLPEWTDRLIVVSTDSVYHPEGKRVPQDENGAAYVTGESYGARKRQMEQTIMQECTLRWTMFRPPHMYGPGSELGCFPTHTRQKDLLAHLRAGKPIRLVDGGNYLIQPLYAGDLAKAMVAAIDNENTFNELFCIAGPDVVTNREYFEILGRILGLEVAFEDVDPVRHNASDEEACLYFLPRVYDLGKLERAGLPVPAVSLEDGLRQQAQYLISQGR